MSIDYCQTNHPNTLYVCFHHISVPQKNRTNQYLIENLKFPAPLSYYITSIELIHTPNTEFSNWHVQGVYMSIMKNLHIHITI